MYRRRWREIYDIIILYTYIDIYIYICNYMYIFTYISCVYISIDIWTFKYLCNIMQSYYCIKAKYDKCMIYACVCVCMWVIRSCNTNINTSSQ